VSRVIPREGRDGRIDG